ncbi:hypothetical protein [Kordiimonas sp.]|uniref:hypothetical protein n=1 Tax=Kordiimonas sp. TaxID=1970157 RepID=UPI003A8EB7F4
MDGNRTGLPQVDRWAVVRKEHSTCLAFIQWLDDEYGVRLDYDHCKPVKPCSLELSAVADRFFGIDRKKLGDERQLLQDRYFEMARKGE